MKQKLLFIVILLFAASLTYSQALDEDFESGTWPPTGWTEQQIGDAAGWQESTAQANSPTHSAYHNDDDVATGCDDWLITPVMDLSSYTTPQLIYWEYVNWGSYAEEHNVLYSTDYSGSGDPTLATWTTINSVIGTEDTWVELEPYTLPTSSTLYVAFQYIGDYASQWWIDDVEVKETPTSPIFRITPFGTNDYGECPLNNYSEEYYTQTFIVENIGIGTLSITGTSLTGGDAAEFSIADTNTYPKNLLAGETLAFDVSFDPATTGAKTTTLQVVANAKANHDVTLNGTAYVAPPRELEGVATATPSVDLSWEIPLPEGEIRYDDGTAETSIWIDDPSATTHFVYTRLNASIAGNLNYIALYNRNNVAGNDWNAIMVCPDNGSGKPDLANPHETFTTPVVNSTTGEWNLLQLTSPVGMTLDEVFYIVAQWPDGNTGGPFILTDDDNHSGRCAWSNDSGASWSAWANNFIMRAYMSTSKTPFVDITAGLSVSGTENLPVRTMKQSKKENKQEITGEKLSYAVPGIYASGNSSKSFTDYTVHRGDVSGTYNTTYTGITTTSYSDVAISSVVTYYYAVTSNYSDGTSDFSNEVEVTTVCAASVTVPYFENFDGVTAPAFPPCMTVEDANGDAIEWVTSTESPLSAPNSAMITYSNSKAMNDWFFTEGLQVIAGKTYEVSFAFKGASSSYIEKLAVDWGSSPVSTSMSGTPIFDNNNITNTSWNLGSGTFTATSTETIYVGFHGYSAKNQYNLYVDDVKVLEAIAATTWAGIIDNDWDTPGNWSNGLPSSATSVTIPTGLTNYPTLGSATTIGTLLVASDATGDASLVNDGLLIVTGDATVQRYITGGVWHDFSASCQGQTLNSVYFGGSPSVWLTHYEESDNSHPYVINLTNPMDPGAGFEIWVETGNNVTVNFTGQLQRFYVTLTTASTPALSYSGSHPLGYNLIGNPFASPIDLDLGTWALTDVSTSFWVWNGTTYLDYNTSGSTGSLTDGIVPMGQGFFIHATSASASITIPSNARVHSTQSYYKGVTQIPTHMSLRAVHGDTYDEMNIVFIEDAVTEFDTYDTRKMFAFEGDAPQLYLEQFEEQLSINGLPMLTEDEVVVNVGYKVGVDGTQILEANTEYLPDTEVFLEDLVTGNVQNLIDNPVYEFEAMVGDNPYRFNLHFNSINGVIDNTSDIGIRVYSYNGTVYIQSKGKVANEIKEIWIYDMFGRIILKTNIQASMLNMIPVDRVNSYLVVRVACQSGATTKKVYINNH